MRGGVLVGHSLEQTAARAKLLGDPSFTAGYYLLHEHNGGKDPSAADPFDRWPFTGRDGVERQAVTADCIGGASWCGGFDRYQPVRFAHLYDGWINTDSMLMDARGPKKCFELLDTPAPGCFLVAPTGAPGFHACGHITTVHTVPDGFELDNIESWKKTLATDVAAWPDPTGKGVRANTTHDITWWFAARHRGGGFVRSIMQP